MTIDPVSHKEAQRALIQQASLLAHLAAHLDSNTLGMITEDWVRDADLINYEPNDVAVAVKAIALDIPVTILASIADRLGMTALQLVGMPATPAGGVS